MKNIIVFLMISPIIYRGVQQLYFYFKKNKSQKCCSCVFAKQCSRVK